MEEGGRRREWERGEEKMTDKGGERVSKWESEMERKEGKYTDLERRP